jgi:hypothetical protein
MHMKWGTALCLALACACAPAITRAQDAPKTQDWTPPSDSVQGGEGNLRDAPLFEPTGERRRFDFTYNPLTLLVVRAQLSFEGLLTDHHALELTAFYGATRTNQVYPNPADPTAEGALTTLFQGAGGELGYRWYSGTAGPRGLYVGPSFLLARYTAIPTRGEGTPSVMTGTSIPYWNLGGAIDVGWQAIFADRWVMNLGGGLMYTVPTHQFPAQELPASVYAIRGLRPRVLLGLGVAFD